MTSISTETSIPTGTSTEIDTGETEDRVANGSTTRSIAKASVTEITKQRTNLTKGEDLKPPGLGTLSAVGRINLKVAGVQVSLVGAAAQLEEVG